MKLVHIAALIALGLASAGFVTPAAMADPPPWAPAHGWRAKHSYVYYPSAEVYYEPASRMWFWLGGAGWQAGVSLPLALHAYVRVGGVNIDLDVDRPYLRNDDVVRRYGGRQRRWWGNDHSQAHGNSQGNGHHEKSRHGKGHHEKHGNGHGNEQHGH
jgi:hypothetical protein